MPAHECFPAAAVHADEVAGPIRQRRLFWRKRARDAAAGGLDYPLPDANDLVGVSLSGGGIRSAMFNLGFLQALQAAGFMKHVDYLSSVSGGGYTNGYYSTLGHFAGSEAEDQPAALPHAVAGPAPLAGLSPRDTQFLLDGQYLNRPVEFLTSYVLSTLLIAGTVFAWLVALATVIALFFRAFDRPAARRWLALFDVQTDLQTGVFASLLLGVSLIAVVTVIRRLRLVCGLGVRSTPGRWAVFLGGALLLGVAVMLGNGDMSIAAGHGRVQRSVDLRFLQVPIMIAVALLFLTFLRVGSLVQSERVNATPLQRIVLAVVLIGTTWGVLFAVVGWVGRENISGYVTDRPATLLPDDIIDYADLARLLKRREVDADGVALRPGLRHLMDEHRRGREAAAAGAAGGGAAGETPLDAAIREVLEMDAIRSRARLDLWPSRRQWTPWRLVGGTKPARWLAGAGALAATLGGATDSALPVNQDRVLDLVASERLVNERGRPLIEALNDALGLDAAAPVGRDVGGHVVRPESSENVTAELCRLAATRVAEAAGIGSASRGIAQLPAGEEAARMPVAAALETLWEWDGIGLTADGRRYQQLDRFLRLLERVRLNPAVYRFDILSVADRALFNRLLLEIAYPELVNERTLVNTAVVVGEDQRARRVILCWALVAGCLGLVLLDINRLCAWFHFYRQRVADTFLRKANVDGVMPLRLLQPTRNGHPYPLFVAGMILPQTRTRAGVPASGAAAAGASSGKLDHSVASNWYSFLFSPGHVGWLPTGPAARSHGLATYRPTTQYRGGSLGVDEAIVLSGAAVTPYMAGSRSLRILMHVFNARLEQWLPNPRLADQPDHGRFTMVDVAREFLGRRPWGEDAWRYGVVADGGFREFLGVEELVARRCRIVIVSDAGCNNGLYEFGVLADLVRKLRLDHGVEVLDLDHDRPLDTARLRRREEVGGRSAQHWLVGRIRYRQPATSAGVSDVGDPPPPLEALLVYVQMSLTGDEDIDIEQFRRTNPQFPDEPISNQFYTRDQVESFRQLGQHVGQVLCRGIEPFDCRTAAAAGSADRSAEAADAPTATEDELRNQRISRLISGFITNYRGDCRQEQLVAGDDARMGWSFRHDDVGNAALARIHRYESSVEHQLLMHDFVWMVLDGTGSDRLLALDESAGDADERLTRITPMDLYGIAIECNRRHAGFRRGWPRAFFQVGGRDLLIKAAHAAHSLVPSLDDGSEDGAGTGSGDGSGSGQSGSALDEFSAWSRAPEGPTPRVVRLLARLAVMIPRGVFRQHGEATAGDAVVCLIVYLLRYRLGRRDLSFEWLQGEAFQLDLRRAIATEKPGEVERVIVKVFRDAFPPAGDATPSARNATPPKRRK